MGILTRQGKGSKLTIEEMDNNLLYLQSLSGTNFTEAKIGSDTNYSLFDEDGSLRFFGNATTYNDQQVDVLSEILGVNNPLKAKVFRNNGATTNTHGIYTSGLTYGTFIVSGYTALNDAMISGVFSISIWSRFPTIGQYSGKIFSIVDNNNTIFSFGMNGVKATIKTSAGVFESTNIISFTKWQHICYVQSGTTATLYVNNVPNNINTPIIVPITSLPDSGFFAIEKIVNSELTSPFTGELTNLRFYNVPLTLDQVIELFNYGSGMRVTSHPTGIVEGTDVIYSFQSFESSGLTLYNSATLGIGKDITFTSEPIFIEGCSQTSAGVYLPVFESPLPGTLGGQRSVRFEMSHDWKTSSPISLHMHVSSNIQILSGQTIIFVLEKTIQDIYGVLSANSLNVINSGKTFGVTSAVTYSFTTNYTIPAYANFILEFDNIDMTNYTSVSTCGAITIIRLTGTFTGDIFEVQPIKMHYEIDGTGSRQRWVK